MIFEWVSDRSLNPGLLALDVVSFLVTLIAVVHSWRSARHVVAENRAWTRAWRIFVVVIFSPSINGVVFPFGAIYALVVYKVPRRSRMPVS